MTHESNHILADGEEFTLDTRATQLNNNVMVIGPSGAGKTRHYVKPNLLQCNESLIVTDTKGLLHREVGPVLAAHGYEVAHIDFTDPAAAMGYNPLDFVTSDPSGGPNERDVMRVAAALSPAESTTEPFWDNAARMLIASLVAYVVGELPERERSLTSVVELATEIQCGATDELMKSIALQKPRSLAARKWKAFKALDDAEKTKSCVLGFIHEKLDSLAWSGVDSMFAKPNRVDFASLGDRRAAVFVTVSDTDRSLDRLVGLFYMQALQALVGHADRDCGGALLVPVRLYLDDFATNCKIENFDKVISVIRSRNIAVSVVLQSITQLETLYPNSAAITIINGCDHLLYLGGQDIATARFVGQRAGRTLDTILAQPPGETWVLERGAPARRARRYELSAHPLYSELPESLAFVEAKEQATLEVGEQL